MAGGVIGRTGHVQGSSEVSSLGLVLAGEAKSRQRRGSGGRGNAHGAWQPWPNRLSCRKCRVDATPSLPVGRWEEEKRRRSLGSRRCKQLPSNC